MPSILSNWGVFFYELMVEQFSWLISVNFFLKNSQKNQRNWIQNTEINRNKNIYIIKAN